MLPLGGDHLRTERGRSVHPTTHNNQQRRASTCMLLSLISVPSLLCDTQKSTARKCQRLRTETETAKQVEVSHQPTPSKTSTTFGRAPSPGQLKLFCRPHFFLECDHELSRFQRDVHFLSRSFSRQVHFFA